MNGPIFAVHIALEAAGYETAAVAVGAASERMGVGFVNAGAGIELLQAALVGIEAHLIRFAALAETAMAPVVAAAASIAAEFTAIAPVISAATAKISTEAASVGASMVAAGETSQVGAAQIISGMGGVVAASVAMGQSAVAAATSAVEEMGAINGVSAAAAAVTDVLSREVVVQSASTIKSQEKAAILAFVRGEYTSLAAAMTANGVAQQSEAAQIAFVNLKLIEKAAYMAYIRGEYETLAIARVAAALAADTEAAAALGAAAGEAAAGAAGGVAAAGAVEAAAGANAATASFGRLAIVLGGIFAALVVVGGAFLLIHTGIKYGEEAEKVFAQTRAVIISTGAAAGYTAEQIASMARSLGNQAAVDNIEVQKQINYLLTFRKISREVLPEATRMVLALGRGMSEKLRSASIQVGKALEDPIRGVTALRRIGVQFTDDMRATIKRLVQMGDLFGAQKIILRELNIEIGKSAEMYAQTFAGQVDIAKTALHEFSRGIGEEVVPALSYMLRDLLGAASGSTTLAERATAAGHAIGNILAQGIYYAIAAFHGLSAVVATVFAGVILGSAAMVDKVLAGFQLMDEGLSHLPGFVGKRFAEDAKDIQSLRDGAVKDLKTVGDAWWQTAKDQTVAAANAVEAAGHHKSAINDVVTGLGKEDEALQKVARAVENYRLQSEKLIEQSRLKAQAAEGLYRATELGTAALEAQRIATARLAAEERGRELNAAAQSRGVSVNSDLPRILADNAEETERWAIALEKLVPIQQLVEQTASDLVSPLSDIRQQLQQLQNSRWFTVGIPPATINSAEEWGKKLTEVGFGIAALKRNLDNLNRSNPQTIALTKQLAESQALYQKAIEDSAAQLAIFRAKLEEPAVTATAGAQRELTLIRERIAFTKQGDAALAIYNVTLNAYNEALRIQSLLIQQVGESDIAYATRRTQVFLAALKAIDAQTEINKIRTDEFLSGLSGAFEILSSGLGGASTQMGRLAADMGRLVIAIKAVGDAQGRTNKILAAAQVVGAIGGALATLNVGGSNKPGGPQALGGRLDSNYAGIGSIVGAIVGAIVGYFTAGIGTGAGFAIGTALGTVLGGLISKAGDSASATLRADGNAYVEESSRQLNGAVKDALTNIFKGLQAAMASLGLLLGDIPFINIKVRDNIVRVIVGSVVRTFSSMQDAISFGIAEALKQSASGGHLPEEVLAALRNTTATDLQALQSDIDFARGIANYGVPAVVQAIDKSISDFFVAMQRAVSLGIDTTKVIAQFADELQSQKDKILGIDKTLSPQDQLRRDVAAFNQKVELLKAQELADIADIEFKKAELQVKIELARAELGIRRAIDIAILQSIQIMEAALGRMDVAIASAQAVLDSLVTISDEELAAALARIGRGGKGSAGGGDALGDLRRMIDDVGKSVRQSGMTDLQRQLDDINTKWRDATSAVHLNSNAVGRIERERADAIRAAMKLDKDKQAAAIKAANERYDREMAGVHKTQEAIAAANAARQQEIDLLGKDLRSRVKDFVNIGKPGAGVIDAINQIDDNAKNLIADARALAKEKGLSPAELHKMVQDIRNAAGQQLAAVTQGVLDSLKTFLGDDGPTGLAGKISGVSEVAAGLIANLQALADKGQITAEQFKELRKRIEDAIPERQHSILRDATNDLFGQLYDLLGMDTEAAQLKYDLAVAELNAKKAELEASMRIAGYTQAQMDAVLGPLGVLIGKVVAAGPGLFASGGGTSASDNHDGQIWTGAGWINAPANANASSSDVADAHDRIQQYLDLALSPFQRSLKALNTEFDKYRLALGNTAEVQRAYALALHDLVTQQLQGLKTYLDSLNTSPQSILSPEQQLAEVQQQIAAAFALAQGGDASQGDVLARLVQQALQLGQTVFPQAGSGYRDLFTNLNAMLRQVWAMFQNGTAPVPSIPGASPVLPPALPVSSGSGGVSLVSGSGQASQLVVNFLPVIQQMQLSTTMLQSSMGRVEGEAKRGADASERAARALETRGNLYRKVS